VLQILSYFWQLCLLRSSPAQLPSSWFATLLVFSIYLIIALVVVSLTRPNLDAFQVIATITIGISIQAAVTWALLQYKDRAGRFPATWSALLGANAVMLIILLPFNFILLESESSTLVAFADSVTWVCLGWWLAIAGYIYHKAVDVSVLQGSCIAFLIELMGVIAAVSLVSS